MASGSEGYKKINTARAAKADKENQVQHHNEIQQDNDLEMIWHE